MNKRYAGDTNPQAYNAEYRKRIAEIREANNANEIEMLSIRPFVKKEDQAFKIHYERVEDFFAQYELNNFLLVTTPGVYENVFSYLNLEELQYSYVYVKDSKIDTLNEIANIVTSELIKKDKNLSGAVSLSTGSSPVSPTSVICMGGGVAMDAGKYLAERLGLPLFAIPTVLSVNAAYCYKAAVREADRNKAGAYNVVYKFYGLPQAICVDLDIITGKASMDFIKDVRFRDKSGARISWNMLRELNIAGAGDLLSIHTASFDWKINSLAARGLEVDNPDGSADKVSLEKPFSQEICDGAVEVLNLLSEYATEIRSGSREGAEFLARAYHWIAEQSWIIQHTMWESASEHGMFDCFENEAGIELTHGQVVALSVFFMSLLQDNQHERVAKLIDRLGIDISLAYLGADDSKNNLVTPATLCACLMHLRNYIEQIAYRYTIISAKPITSQWILESLDYYYKTVYEKTISRYENRRDLYSEDMSEATRGEYTRLENIKNRLQLDLQVHKDAFKLAQESNFKTYDERLNRYFKAVSDMRSVYQN